MSNTPPPPQGTMLGQGEFTILPSQRGRAIRAWSLIVGVVSLVLGLLAGFVIVTAGLGLPTSEYASTVFYVGMGGIAAFFHVFSSIALLGGRSAVRTDQLNVTVARKTRRLLTVLWAGTAVATALSIYAFTKLVRGSHIGYQPPISAYLIVLCVPIVLASINTLVGNRLFRPAH